MSDLFHQPVRVLDRVPLSARTFLALLPAVVLLTACQGIPIFQGVSSAPPQPQGDVANVYLVLPAPDGLETPARGFANPMFEEAIDPVAPLTSFSYVPRLVPGNDRSVLQGSYSPLVQTPAGPAFAWQETENFLVLGTDRRGAEGNWRTDTIMIVGLDRERNRAAVLSIPRDLYVQIPNYGWGRINQVDYLGERVLPVEGGGPALVADVVNNVLGVRIDHWARVEMSGFQSLVDAVGGVTIHLDCPFYEPIYNLTTEQWEYFTLPAGDVTMDGETAYWFVRLRLRESDIGRSQRQRQFLWALRDRASQTNLIVRFPELWNAYREIFSTDLTLLEMVDYMRLGLTLDSSNVRATGISLSDLELAMTDGGASVLRIGDPGRVAAVVNSVWDAPAMVDAYRQDSTNCAPVPPDVQAALGLPSEWVQTPSAAPGAPVAADGANPEPDAQEPPADGAAEAEAGGQVDGG